jgi:hypothetical protein
MAEPVDPDQPPQSQESPEPWEEATPSPGRGVGAQLRRRLEGVGPLPRFPASPTLRQPPEPPRSDPDQPGPPATTESSPASTDPVEVVKERPEPSAKDLKDLQSAIAQAVDIGFVWAGQLMGGAEKRAKGLDRVDPKWTPTPAERRFVSDPAGRIARRHVHADATALDTVDGLLIAVGVGAFGTRRAFDLDPLDQENTEP